MDSDRIEFWGPGGELVGGADSSMVPPVGSFISIRKKTWKVVRVTFALDYSDTPSKKMRANVDLVPE